MPQVHAWKYDICCCCDGGAKGTASWGVLWLVQPTPSGARSLSCGGPGWYAPVARASRRHERPSDHTGDILESPSS